MGYLFETKIFGGTDLLDNDMLFTYVIIEAINDCKQPTEHLHFEYK